MQTCPKCGFSQPPDKYCAQCGVDMDTFIPKEPPLRKKLFGSSIFYIFLLIAFVSTTTYFIYDRILVQVAEKGDLSLSGEVDYTNIDDIESARPALAENSAPAENSIPIEVEESPYSETQEMQNFAESKDNQVRKFQFYLILASQESPLFSQAELQDAQVGIIPNFKEELKRASGESGNTELKHLFNRRFERKIQSEVDSEMIEVRGSESENFGEIGLTMALHIPELTSVETKIRPEVSVFLLEGNQDDPRPTQDTPPLNEYSLQRGSALFIFGILPRRKPTELELKWLPTSLISAMNSELFLERLAEFFILIEFEE